MRFPLSLLLIFAVAASSSVFNNPASSPGPALVDQIKLMYSILIPMMFAMATLAVAVYVGGQFFGAETRAKASVWSQGMLVAVGMSAVIIVFTSVILPGFFSGDISDFDPVQKLLDLRNAAANALAAIVMIMVVIAAALYGIGQMFGVETRARAAVYANGLISGAVFAAVLYIVLGNIIPQFETSFSGLGPYGANVSLYGSVVINIVFFVAFFILITYALSKVFKVPEWEAYLNVELSNLLS